MAAKSARGIKYVIQSVAGLFAEPTIRRTIPTTLSYSRPTNVLTLSTGFRPLDKALEIGGLPYGHLTELIGPGLSSGGVTGFASRIAARVQRQQEMVTIIDMNHSFDPWLAERCGLIAPQLLLTRPETVFEALTTMESAARSAGLVIVSMGIVSELLQHVEPNLLRTLLWRLQNITRASPSVFLFITIPLKNDPFSSVNYPPSFPLAEVADVRLWLQDEVWTHKAGLATAYKANLTVIKNQFAMAGKGADIKIKLSGS